MSWETQNMGYGYYGGGDEYDADAYEAEFEEQPPQRQRQAPRSPGLRAYMKQQASEIKTLKQQVEEQKAMLAELMEGDSPQPSQGAYPRSRLTEAEQIQYQRLAEMGAVGVAPPAGSDAEMAARIRATRSADELRQLLAGQGAPLMQNYNGTGAAY